MLPAHVDGLPALHEVVPAEEWAADVVTATETLFRSGLRVLRDGDGDGGGLLVTGGAAIRALAKNAALGAAPVEFLTGRSAARQRSAATQVPPHGVAAFDAFLRNQVFTMNAPLHARVRRVVSRHLMPKAVLGMTEHAERVMAEVLGEATGGPGDLARDIAGPYVTRFWTAQLGMPATDAARVQRLMHEMNRIFLLAPTPEDRTRMLTACAAYMELVGGTVTDALGRGDNALLGDLAEGLRAVDLPGTPEDLGAVVAANFFDGFHTVGVAVANTAYCLLADPPSAERVRRDPSLAANAFTEGVRLAAPLMFTTRMARSDVTYEGLRIPEGTPVTMVWIAGNRDPEVVDDPQAYRLDREPLPGTTFGGGARICPGRNAARMLSEVALRALTAPGVDVRLEPSAQGWRQGSAIRQRHAIPVTIRQAAAA